MQWFSSLRVIKANHQMHPKYLLFCLERHQHLNMNMCVIYLDWWWLCLRWCMMIVFVLMMVFVMIIMLWLWHLWWWSWLFGNGVWVDDLCGDDDICDYDDVCDRDVLCDDDGVCVWYDDDDVDGTKTLFFSTKSPTLPATLDTVPAVGAWTWLVHSVLNLCNCVLGLVRVL